jgi:hypothetical protein
LALPPIGILVCIEEMLDLTYGKAKSTLEILWHVLDIFFLFILKVVMGLSLRREIRQHVPKVPARRRMYDMTSLGTLQAGLQWK